MNRHAKFLALLFALVLVAVACGGDDSTTAGEEGTDTTAAESAGGGVDEKAAEEAVAGADEETTTTVATAAGSIEELEAQWAEARQAVVDKIKAGGYGIDENNVLIGPDEFKIDLNNCPSDWSDTASLTDTSIVIGHTTAQSGNLAAYGNIAAGMEAYFDYVNDNGGIGGRNIELVVKDDEYVATKTIELVDELLQSENPFAITTLGSPNTLAVYDTLNEKCVPHPFVMTGHPAWGDPVNHPWTNGLQMSYATEAILWGNWIKTNLADDLPVKVAGLVMDNDFGLAYEDGFQKWADANPDVVSEFLAVPHDPAAPTVTNEMTTIASSNPDVFISMTAGNPCLLAVQEAGNSGLTETTKALFAPSVCKDPNSFMIPAGDVAEGWNIVGGGLKVTTDPQYADDPYIKWANETMDAAGLDTTVGNYGTGFAMFAWPYVEALRIANELDGGLTRTNLELAIRAMDLNHPLVLDGVTFAVDGDKDAYFIEGSEFSKYDAANGSWIQQGAVIDLNGSSPNCPWTESGC
ncbi:MAG: ABC transporter substrate-binding protein [Acidimicrobiia bacterium]|nr:ABC transporter substrate-binding protein [Acidimicrobiia bacterium]